MNTEEQRIAIAEACGWKQVTRDNKPEEIWENQKHPLKICRGESKIPDYLNDLNAMHDAWLTLSPFFEKEQFESELYSIVIGGAEYNRNDDAGWITNATAAQRAESFLKTLNLWKP